MNKNGPIVIVEDDEDDQQLIKEAFGEQKNGRKIIYFGDGSQAYEYLSIGKADPFIIISDINMPKLSGIELRDKMQQVGDIRLKAVPFIFLTSATARDTTIQAYLNSVQGFFRKSGTYHDFCKTIKRIVEYWEECAAPNIA